MATTITIKLNRPANEFQAGESIGFGISGGVKYYDHKTKQNEWTNYKAVIFTRMSKQIEFYRSVLIEGAIVEVTGLNQKIDVYEGQNGTNYTIELLDARLGMIHAPEGAQSGGRQAGGQPQYQQQAQQQQAAPIDDFEDSIPF